MTQPKAPSRYARFRATELIRLAYKSPSALPADYDRRFRKRMVELYWLLTGEMPQVPGIECDFPYSFDPALEWTPHEADPGKIMNVYPGRNGEPDILVKGDQDAPQEEKRERVASIGDRLDGPVPYGFIGNPGRRQ